MTYLVLGLIGAIAGAALMDLAGLLFGAVLGVVLARVLALAHRISRLETRLEALDVGLLAREVAEASLEDEESLAFDLDLPAPAARESTPARAAIVEAATPGASAAAVVAPRPTGAPGAGLDVHGEPMPRGRVMAAIRAFFTGGNLVVRAGMVIVFFGVAFLLKYAVQKNAVPLEVRFAAITAGALVMFALGWRLRRARALYALILQGGAIGVLYLTVFAGAKIYSLYSLGTAFALMVALVIACGTLAVAQDSRTLAGMGGIGGFLAPVLSASGHADHVVLFSYYGLLNAGILGIAWFRAWRSLNLIGFVFTFLIATAWGVFRYRPALFSTTEPFLVLFFLFYVAIAVLYATRQPPRLRGLVDGSIVFGVPLVAFTLQTALVADMRYGAAWSAVAAGGFYLALGASLKHMGAPGMVVLRRAFGSLGVVFASVAVPFAVDGHWTGATWALEGAALVWVGFRQHRVAARLFGLALQIGAGVAFALDTDHGTSTLPVLNSITMGAATLSLAALFTSYLLQRDRAHAGGWERALHAPVLVWGLLWWFGAGINEIAVHVADAGNQQPSALLALFALSFAALAWLESRLEWAAMRHPPVALLPLAALVALGIGHESPGMSLLSGWGAPAWLGAFAVQYWLLWRYESKWPDKLTAAWQLGTMWLAVYVLSLESAWRVARIPDLSGSWVVSVWGLIPSLAVLALLLAGRRVRWPIARFEQAVFGPGIALLAAALLAWELRACFDAGVPTPLPYLPLASPLDLAQCLAFGVVGLWMHQCRKTRHPLATRLPGMLAPTVLGGVGFLWLNALVARTVHAMTGVAYAAWPMFHSQPFQAAIAIVWTLTALGLMAGATRRGHRSPWIAGAALLALVILKLFAVDLAGTGTVARIVSFLAVGVLMLLIGYLAPMPPAAAAPGSRPPPEPA